VVISIVPLFIFVGKSFSPVDDRSEFQLTIRAPEGSSLAATTNVAERIARDIRSLAGVTDTLTSVGTATDQAMNRASVYVKLAPIEQRAVSQQDIALQTRQILARYPSDLRTSIGQANAGAGGDDWGSFDLQYALTGPDLDKLAMYSQQLVEKLKTVPKVVDADTTLIYGKPELRVEIDRQR
jgi:hydrophobic/amphiphilic exporter-1 (mainly G- bacteria), HAE1 family